MRYLGSKTKLLDIIKELVDKYNVQIIKDVFSGTCSVGEHFNKDDKYNVHSCDVQYYSYILQYCKIKVNKKFLNFNNLEEEIKEPDYENVLQYLNNIQEEEFIADGFIYQNYSPYSINNCSHKRLFFTEYNAKKIDTIRVLIEVWKNELKITEMEYYYLLGCLLEGVSSVLNTAGTCYAYLKNIEDKKMELKNTFLLNGKNENTCHNMDSINFIKNIKGDLDYLDPPYNTRQYSSYFHIYETISRYDNPEIKKDTKSGVRNDCFKSKFSIKGKIVEEFEMYIKYSTSKYYLISYSNGSDNILSKEDIITILEKYGKIIENLEINHNKHTSKKNKGDKTIKEFLILMEKNIYDINKSQLICNENIVNEYKKTKMNKDEFIKNLILNYEKSNNKILFEHYKQIYGDIIYDMTFENNVDIYDLINIVKYNV